MLNLLVFQQIVLNLSNLILSKTHIAVLVDASLLLELTDCNISVYRLSLTVSVWILYLTALQLYKIIIEIKQIVINCNMFKLFF